MNIKIFGVVLLLLFALVTAKECKFKVVSLYGKEYNLGVLINSTIYLLSNEKFPVFSGKFDVDSITQYQYVVLNSYNIVIEVEDIIRTYSEENSKLNEVYNRSTKINIEIPDLPRPFKSMFPMGTSTFQPIPNNIIYNVFANCDDTYRNLTNSPFVGGSNVNSGETNKQLSYCTFNIISPKNNFSTKGTLHIIGYGSRMYKKLSWAMKFDKKFLGRRAMKLRALASDPTLIREKLAIELYKAVGVPVQEGTYARLVINGDVYGLYSLTDSFSRRWLGAYVHGDEDKEIGFSYKMYTNPPQYPDFRYLGEDYHEYTHNYVPDEYEEMDINPNVEASKFNRIIEFTRLFDRWVKNYGNDMSDTAIKELEKFLNIESLVRLLVIDTLILALDNFWIRMSNAAIYYNPDKNKYQIIPYDFDRALYGGIGDTILDLGENRYLFDCYTWAFQHEELIDHYFTKNILNHPQIKQRYDVVLARTSRETFNSYYVSNYLKAVADLIREDVQWNFESTDRLQIGYTAGIVNRYTLEEFESNRGYGHVGYDRLAHVNDAEFGLQEYVDIRGNSCKSYTKYIDLSFNDNISDKEEIPEFHPDIKGESSLAFSIKASFLLIITQYIFFIQFFI